MADNKSGNPTDRSAYIYRRAQDQLRTAAPGAQKDAAQTPEKVHTHEAISEENAAAAFETVRTVRPTAGESDPGRNTDGTDAAADQSAAYSTETAPPQSEAPEIAAQQPQHTAPNLAETQQQGGTSSGQPPESTKGDDITPPAADGPSAEQRTPPSAQGQVDADADAGDTGSAEQEETPYGTLIVEVYTASGAFPVEDALVTITSYSEGLVSVLETGRSGQTPPVRLSAPPRSNSFVPGGTAPYTLYNIDTDARGYYGVRNVGAAIYPGITSIQRVELFPISDGYAHRNGSEHTFNENTQPNL